MDIIKDREEGSNTNYDDRALDDDTFRWDTQNKTTPDSAIGQSYIHGRQTMLLFVRQQATFPDDKYRTMGYVYLGRVTYISHEYKNMGNRMQMQIKWRMKEKIPAAVMGYAKLKEVI